MSYSRDILLLLRYIQLNFLVGIILIYIRLYSIIILLFMLLLTKYLK